MRDMRNVHRVLVSEPEGNRPFRRPRHRLEGSVIILVDLKHMGWEDVTWIHLAQTRDQ
jgi:hypothetical protein